MFKEQAMGQRQRYVLIGGAIAAFCAGGLLYASPYITLYQVYQAVKRNDIQAVAGHVDFPALRESVKANARQVFSQASGQQNNPLFGLVGAIIGGVVLSPVIDQVVTPEGVAALLEGQRLQMGAVGQPELSKKAESVDVNPRYESFNQFVVGVKPKGENTAPVDIILSRDWLDWKISGVRLPRP